MGIVDSIRAEEEVVGAECNVVPADPEAIVEAFVAFVNEAVC